MEENWLTNLKAPSLRFLRDVALSIQMTNCASESVAIAENEIKFEMEHRGHKKHEPLVPVNKGNVEDWLASKKTQHRNGNRGFSR